MSQLFLRRGYKPNELANIYHDTLNELYLWLKISSCSEIPHSTFYFSSLNQSLQLKYVKSMNLFKQCSCGGIEHHCVFLYHQYGWWTAIVIARSHGRFSTLNILSRPELRTFAQLKIFSEFYHNVTVIPSKGIYKPNELANIYHDTLNELYLWLKISSCSEIPHSTFYFSSLNQSLQLKYVKSMNLFKQCSCGGIEHHCVFLYHQYGRWTTIVVARSHGRSSTLNIYLDLN